MYENNHIFELEILVVVVVVFLAVTGIASECGYHTLTADSLLRLIYPFINLSNLTFYLSIRVYQTFTKFQIIIHFVFNISLGSKIEDERSLKNFQMHAITKTFCWFNY